MQNRHALRLSLLLAVVSVCVPVARAAGGRPADQGAQGAPISIDFRAAAEDGTPILDLKSSEVSLKINGRPKEIRSLELVQLKERSGTAPVSALPPPFATNAAPERGRDI